MRTTALRVLLLTSALCASIAARATSIKDFWQSRAPDSPRLQSTKTMGALEMCLGMTMSENGGPPSVLHGDGEIIMTSMATGVWGMTAPIYGFHIVDRGSVREIIVGAVQSGGWTNKAVHYAQGCL